MGKRNRVATCLARSVWHDRKVRLRRRYLVLLALLPILCALVWTCALSPQQEYRGKKFSDWVVLYYPDLLGAIPRQNGEPRDAIHYIGTNALPYLLEWMRYQPPQWKIQLYERANNVFGWPGNDWLDQKAVRAYAAAKAFAALGPDGLGAISQLSRMLISPPVACGYRAANALASLGAPGLPPLLAVLTNRQAGAIRGLIAVSIGDMGSEARPAVPLLVQCLSEQDYPLAINAAVTLGRLRLALDFVVPALVKTLQATNQFVRQMAIVSLARFGEEARPALSALKALLSESDPATCAVARQALNEIDRKTLKKASPEGRKTPQE